MKKANDLNINTRVYWNGIYGTDVKRAAYISQGTDKPVELGHNHYVAGQHTARFTRAVEEVNDGDKVLDIGCGVGAFTKLVKQNKKDCEIWGTDISDQAMLDNSKEDPDIKYIHQYIGSQDKVPSDYFDFVFSGEVLEHMDDPAVLIQDAHRVLKKGGKFVLTTPNEDNIRSEEHTWIFKHEDVEKLFKDNGFKDVRFVFLPDMEHLLVIFCVGIKE